MEYPTLQQIEDANDIQLCRWHRFLRSPHTKEETTIINKIYDKVIVGGLMTPAISKLIGWG